MNLYGVDLNLLTAFEALTRERNVSRAANEVGITQPAMSNALARLRVLFNDPLLVRAGRAMVLTARAQELDDPLRQALNVIRRTLSAPGISSVDALARTFTVGTTEYAEYLLLPHIVNRLQRSAPNVRLVVKRLPTLFQMPEMELRDGLLDLAIGFFADGPSLGPTLSSEFLFSDRHVAVLRKGHPNGSSRLSLKRFQSFGHVAISYRTDRWSIVDQMLRQRGIERRIVVSVPHMMSALALVSATNLICSVPQRIALAFESSMRLQCIRLPLPIPPAKCRLAWHSRYDHDEGLIWLREQIKAVSAAMA